MRASFVWMLVVLTAVAPGCVRPQGQDYGRPALRAAADTYATTLTLLAEYRQAGLIDDEAARRIEQARVVARLALDQWRAALQADQPPAQAADSFQRALSQLITERIRAEQRRPQP